MNGRKGCAVQPRAQLERLSDTGLSPLDAQRIRRGSGRHAALANFGARGRGRKAGGGLPGHPRSKPAVWARAPWSRDGASAGPTSALGRGPGGRSGARARPAGALQPGLSRHNFPTETARLPAHGLWPKRKRSPVPSVTLSLLIKARGSFPRKK